MTLKFIITPFLLVILFGCTESLESMVKNFEKEFDVTVTMNNVDDVCLKEQLEKWNNEFQGLSEGGKQHFKDRISDFGSVHLASSIQSGREVHNYRIITTASSESSMKEKNSKNISLTNRQIKKSYSDSSISILGNTLSVQIYYYDVQVEKEIFFTNGSTFKQVKYPSDLQAAVGAEYVSKVENSFSKTKRCKLMSLTSF